MALFSFLAVICTRIFNILGETWKFLGSIIQFASSSEATVSSYEVSMWRSLWNDLFSQVVRWPINSFWMYVISSKTVILIGGLLILSFSDFPSSQKHSIWACCLFRSLQQASTKVYFYSIPTLSKNLSIMLFAFLYYSLKDCYLKLIEQLH